MRGAEAEPSDLALAAAQLLSIDPLGLGGAVLRGGSHAIRQAWLSGLRAACSPAIPWRRMPPGITEDRLIGGLDLGATLAGGRPSVARGILADVADGVLLISGAERVTPATAATIAAAIDGREVALERDGIARRLATRFTMILIDDGFGDDERVPAALDNRVAFRVDLAEVPTAFPALSPEAARGARERLPHVTADAAAVEALCAAGLAFGVRSLRAATFALGAAKAAAALAGREAVAEADIELAAALVIAPRATQLPQMDQPQPVERQARQDEQAEADRHEEPMRDEATPADPPNGSEPVPPPSSRSDEAAAQAGGFTDIAVEATRAALPAHLLAALNNGTTRLRHAQPKGRAGAAQAGATRGRPAGSRRGKPGAGKRLALIDTLRAAAPWQELRRRGHPATSARILVRGEDFRITRSKARSESLTVFAVDASGSSALHRLAEAKGAVELILAECYVRRDQVALIAFRHAEATLVLPPTHSLARAKRALAGQVGGGGTPLAAALDVAAAVASAARRKGRTPLVVLMTDGKANIDRAGRPGRSAAEADALAAARVFRQDAVASLLVDIAPRSAEAARKLASAMGARYLALPHADARRLSQAVLGARPNE